MAWYRVYFLDSGNKIAVAENIEADDDTAATEKARAVFADNGFPAFELWQGSRVVHKETRVSAG